MQGLRPQSGGMESDPQYESLELAALATRGGRPLSLLSADSPAAQPPPAERNIAMTCRLFIPIAVIAATASLLLANPASATPPTTEETPADYSQSFTGADSPCGFDITFSGAGTVTVTTYYDNTGTPIRESIHGSLAHTVS